MLSVLRDGTRDEKIGARSVLGRILEGRGLLDEAAECYETNVGLGVRDQGLYERLAGVYRRQGRTDLADEVLAEAEQMPPVGAATPIAPAAPSRRAPIPPPEPLQAPTLPDDDRPSTRPDRAATADRVSASPPWFATPAAIVLSVILCGPFGLVLMWGRAPWRTGNKLLVSGAWCGVALLLAFFWIRATMSSITGGAAGPSGTPIGVAGSPTMSLPPGITGPGPSPSPPPSLAVGSPGPSPGVVQIFPSGDGATATPPVASPSPLPLPATALSPAAKPAGQPSPAALRARVTNTAGQGANLRASPSAGANRLKNVPEGTTLDVVGPDRPSEGRTWRNVRDADGTTGWIVADFLTPQ